MQNKAKYLAAALLSGLMLATAAGAPAVSAAEHYHVYNYDCWGEATPSQAGYEAQRSVSGLDLGCGAFNTPSDLFRDWNDQFYVVDSGNNRIVVADRTFTKVNRILERFTLEDGSETTLKAPEGVYVSEDTGLIYIADTGNSRLLVCDEDGNVQMELKRPDSTLYENETFKPQKVLVDKAGNIYMVLNNITNGAAMFNSEGEFQGYFGANSVDATAEVVANYFWNMIATDEMRANSSRNVAAGITNFDVDDEGFITPSPSPPPPRRTGSRKSTPPAITCSLRWRRPSAIWIRSTTPTPIRTTAPRWWTLTLTARDASTVWIWKPAVCSSTTRTATCCSSSAPPPTSWAASP